VLKAFGYRNRDVGIHYVKLVLVIALRARSVGHRCSASGRGGALGKLYLEFYRFPYLDTHCARGGAHGRALTAGASLVGVLRAVRRAVRLPPAEAMRPAPPATFRRTIVERSACSACSTSRRA
jgi:putative ABC transport system permease protein